MSVFEPNNRHLREVLLFCFNWKKSAAEAHRMFVETYGEACIDDSTCRRWYRRFKEGDFDTEDKPRPGQPKKFEDEELEELLDQDSCQTQEELAESLGVSQKAISDRLKALGMIQKKGHWVPHELTPRDVERRLCISEMLLARYKKKSFLSRIVTGDEKWIYFDNPKRLKSWGKPGHPSTSQPKQDIHSHKVMLSIWWDEKGPVHYEFLEPGETIKGPLYRRQLMRLKLAIEAKRPEWKDRHEKLIFHQDNARPHIESSVKTYLENTGWEILPHPPYSPDFAPSDYYLFRSMQNALTGTRFSSFEEVKNWAGLFLASKDRTFYKSGIQKLPELWSKVVASDGQYFN